MLGTIEQALIALLLIGLMIGMGATLTVQSFRDVAQRPRGVLIGVASQFGFMPLVAFSLAHLFELPAGAAIGLVLIGCSPGGTTSNMFTYFARADVALSVSMTATSTLLAVAMMPLCLYLYATPFTTAELSVPLGKVAVTLAVVLIPVAIGMVIRERSLKAARRAERVGSIAGALVLILLIVSAVLRNQEEFFRVGFGGYASAIALGIAGMGLGYLASTLFGLPRARRRAVAFETGIQNSPLAFAIIGASFDGPSYDAVMRLPLLYALFVLISATLLTLAFRREAMTPPLEEVTGVERG